MATGESAFSSNNAYNKYGCYAPLNRLYPGEGLQAKRGPTRHSSTNFNKNRKSTNTNLVNIKSIKRNKTSPVNFVYLINAYKLMYKDSDFCQPLKRECENQSANSLDDTSSSNAKRFEKEVVLTKKASSEVVMPTNNCPSYSELISDESSYFSRPKRFGDRPDVIYKTILRSFKKYYLTEFNEVTDYKKKKRRIANQSYLIEMSKNYVDQKIGQSQFEDLELFVAALVQPKLPPSLECNSRLVELSKVVCEVLYRFNKSKMADLLAYPQFSYLLKMFLSIPNLLEFIGERSNSPQATENLQAQIDYLLGKCNDTLAYNRQTNFGETQNIRNLSNTD